MIDTTKRCYPNMSLRPGEMITCILNEGILFANPKNSSEYTLESEIRVDDMVELDFKIDNVYDGFFSPFVKKCDRSSKDRVGYVISEPRWLRLPTDHKTIRDWEVLRDKHYHRLAVVYMIHPIVVVNNRYVVPGGVSCGVV